MATITLQRSNEFINRMRDYHIYIDGKKVGNIANGETKEFEITNGQHSIEAKIDWCRSPIVNFSIETAQSKLLNVGSFKYGNLIIPSGLGLIAFGYLLAKYFDNEWFLFLGFP